MTLDQCLAMVISLYRIIATKIEVLEDFSLILSTLKIRNISNNSQVGIHFQVQVQDIDSKS